MRICSNCERHGAVCSCTPWSFAPRRRREEQSHANEAARRDREMTALLRRLAARQTAALLSGANDTEAVEPPRDSNNLPYAYAGQLNEHSSSGCHLGPNPSSSAPLMGVFDFLIDEISLCARNLPFFVPDFGVIGPGGVPADYVERNVERLNQRARLYCAQQAAADLLDFDNLHFEIFPLRTSTEMGKGGKDKGSNSYSSGGGAYDGRVMNQMYGMSSQLKDLVDERARREEKKNKKKDKDELRKEMKKECRRALSNNGRARKLMNSSSSSPTSKQSSSTSPSSSTPQKKKKKKKNVKKDKVLKEKRDKKAWKEFIEKRKEPKGKSKSHKNKNKKDDDSSSAPPEASPPKKAPGQQRNGSSPQALMFHRPGSPDLSAPPPRSPEEIASRAYAKVLEALGITADYSDWPDEREAWIGKIAANREWQVKDIDAIILNKGLSTSFSTTKSGKIGQLLTYLGHAYVPVG